MGRYPWGVDEDGDVVFDSTTGRTPAMATSRERAAAELYCRGWVDGAMAYSEQEPNPETLADEAIKWWKAIRAESRALAPTDEEREAMREVVEKARAGSPWIRSGVAYMCQFGGIAEINAEQATQAANELDAALARLDAATGGRGDG